MATVDPTRPAPPAPSAGNRLGEILRERGLIDDAQLQYALQKNEVEQQRLGRVLIKHGLASESDIVQVQAELQGIDFVQVETLPEADPQVLAMFNRELCQLRQFLPLRRAQDALEVLLGDADREVVAQLVLQRCGLRCRFVQGEYGKVARLIRHTYYFAQNPVESLLTKEMKRLSADADHAFSPEKLLDYLLHLAVRERTTDIHIAPSEGSLHVLFRVDGVLRPMFAMPSSLSRLLGFIKLAAEMDISEQRRPQDGSFRAVVLDSPVTVRVSTIITDAGERTVMRLLPEHTELAGLAELGFFPEDVAALERLFAKPAGLVLITGPTGSGKSSSLHAALRMQSLIQRNVLTVEDPIEYRVPGAGQTEVNRRAGYEFGSALRHFLRHDPDVILLGEMRDAETAQAAVEAAATGHLVLSTLHVTSVFGVVPRLRPLGLQAQVIADNLLAVVNQRLARQNCPHCSVEVPFTEPECRWLGLPSGATGRRGQGCERCRGSGYYGRLPIYDVLIVDEALANGIADDIGREGIRSLAQQAGFRGIEDIAKARVIKGQTTPEEVLRVAGVGPAP
ncbi:GspE/PulE family protein [Coralloluteibacterium stylophorae]|uniref:Flp pilus assembly complex ATPase component TadA n=1 Tax=Coralloluteibacterium stylophorae TaxID=1776034 RepID=A0A8J7VVM3_9GAMM|nr:GspE/PulE family protein [Coralloluteibacterium stylophorae]MBS7456799.1 Flp pilus assembly complex ATPase component TadA [Coralloluteibacterium stylophorae]